MRLKERLYRFRSFWIFPVLAVLLVSFTFNNAGRSPRDLLWLVPIGLFVWSLLEYTLHRFIFHMRFQVRNPRLREALNASHLVHHVAPRDEDKLLVRTPFALLISALVFAITLVFSANVASSSGVMTGIWAGFLYYEAVHYRVHLRLSNSRLISWQRRAHFYHHFTNNKRCFGVTSPLWDYVFRTQLPRQSR
jgi:sterol desaturase/sphingolipid hydroxylase (fatty acid hydroxylase superfamily)